MKNYELNSNFERCIHETCKKLNTDDYSYEYFYIRIYHQLIYKVTISPTNSKNKIASYTENSIHCNYPSIPQSLDLKKYITKYILKPYSLSTEGRFYIIDSMDTSHHLRNCITDSYNRKIYLCEGNNGVGKLLPDKPYYEKLCMKYYEPLNITYDNFKSDTIDEDGIFSKFNLKGKITTWDEYRELYRKASITGDGPDLRIECSKNLDPALPIPSVDIDSVECVLARIEICYNLKFIKKKYANATKEEYICDVMESFGNYFSIDYIKEIIDNIDSIYDDIKNRVYIDSEDLYDIELVNDIETISLMQKYLSLDTLFNKDVYDIMMKLVNLDFDRWKISSPKERVEWIKKYYV